MFWSHHGLIQLNIKRSYSGHMTNVYLRVFVKRARNRLKVLNLLSEKEKTQAELHHQSKMYRTHVRRTLLELEEKGLVKCLNPKDKLGRFYELTELGEKVQKELLAYQVHP